MGLYDRILNARDFDAASGLFDRIRELEHVQAERHRTLAEARRLLAHMEEQFRQFMGGKGGPAGWKDQPDPDRIVLDWFDSIVGRSGPAAVRPLLERYHSMGWLTDSDHEWFLNLANTFGPFEVAALPDDPAVLASLDAQTQEFLGRLRPAAAS